jgi:hypothetical protein
MNQKDEKAMRIHSDDGESLEPELRQALGDFKASVDAWSEAMMSRPREVKTPARVKWGVVTKWALGCVVFAGTVSGGVYENHRQQQAAKVEAARVAEHQREVAAQRSSDEQDLMAKVDSDVSQEVPSALEPLASLMDDSGNSGN